jgi:hypothetical protein
MGDGVTHWADLEYCGSAIDLTPEQIALIAAEIDLPVTTAQDDVIVGAGSPSVGTWIKKTLAEFKSILGLGTAAYTATTDYCADDDSRLSDARTPTSHGNAAHTSTFITAGDVHSNANDPTTDEKAALDGTGVPSGTNKFVNDDDARMTNARTPTSHGNTEHTSTFITAGDVHSNANDPSADEKSALTGTSGTPSGTNKYVTNADSRNSDARTPTSHGNTQHTSTFITADDIPSLSELGGEPTANKATDCSSNDDTHFPTTQGVNEAIAAAGAGVPTGGTTGQALVKNSNTNYDTTWDDVGGTFSGTMDDITDGTTYVKTHNDYTDTEQSKLAGIAEGAEVNVQADWNAASGDAFINNKPTTMAPSSHGNAAHSSTFITAGDVHSNANDPTADEKAALDGTGIPSGTNKFVTDDDSRMDDSRTPTSHGNAAHTSTFITAGDVHSNANDPSSDQKNALAGTSGLPSGSNKYVTDGDARNTNARTPTSHGNTEHTSTFITAGDVHSNTNDPTSDQKSALAGTSGTPSGTNKYVTNDDSRNTNARTPTSHGNTEHTSAFITSLIATEIIQAATDTLDAAECYGTIINNYGQSAANTQTLPAAAAGLSFMAIVATSGMGALHFKANTGDKIYLDGTALDDADKVSCATPAVGNCAAFFAFKTGASAYDWYCNSIHGTWTDGGA